MYIYIHIFIYIYIYIYINDIGSTEDLLSTGFLTHHEPEKSAAVPMLWSESIATTCEAQNYDSLSNCDFKHSKYSKVDYGKYTWCTKFKFLPVTMATEYYAQMNGDADYTTKLLRPKYLSCNCCSSWHLHANYIETLPLWSFLSSWQIYIHFKHLSCNPWMGSFVLWSFPTMTSPWPFCLILIVHLYLKIIGNDAKSGKPFQKQT